MSIASETNKVVYNCNGSTTAFDITFTTIKDSSGNATQIKVVLTDETTGEDTELTVTTHYTISGDTVTTVATYSTNYKLTIARDPAFTQEVDNVYGGTIDPDVLDAALDKLTTAVQAVKEIADRAFKISIAETADLTIPLATVRANKVLAFDADGAPYAASDVTSATVSAFMQTVLDDATAAAALATLGIYYHTQTVVCDLTATNMGSTSEPVFSGIVTVAGTNVSLSSVSGTGWSGLSTSSDVFVYVQSDGSVVYSATAPSWSATYRGYYNSTDRAVMWLRKDSGDAYRYKRWMPTTYEAAVVFGIIVEIGDWDMDTDASAYVASEVDSTEVIGAKCIIRTDNDSSRVPIERQASPYTQPSGAFVSIATNIALERVASGYFDSANFDSTSYNRGWVILDVMVM